MLLRCKRAGMTPLLLVEPSRQCWAGGGWADFVDRASVITQITAPPSSGSACIAGIAVGRLYFWELMEYLHGGYRLVISHNY